MTTKSYNKMASSWVVCFGTGLALFGIGYLGRSVKKARKATGAVAAERAAKGKGKSGQDD